MAFLWASLALFDDASDAVDTAAVYRPRRWDWHSIPEARARILRLLAEAPAGERFERFLPDTYRNAAASWSTRAVTESRVRSISCARAKASRRSNDPLKPSRSSSGVPSPSPDRPVG
jgi:hypothetical protein